MSIRAMPAPDRERAASILAQLWNEVVEGREESDTTLQVEQGIRARIRQLLRSEMVAFTYSLPTQLLGKLTDPSLDALCLQRGDNAVAQWDPRSFATRVIVPWVRDNENVLGNSPDPYVSNPLRQARVTPDPPNVRPNTLPLWQSLYAVLNSVEERSDPEYTRAVFRLVLAQVHEILMSRQFDYPVLRRASLEQTLYVARRLLEESREGEHAMSLAAALFTVVGRRFGLWEVVIRHQSTTADRATGMVGDLECRKAGVLVYAVEVKEGSLTLADVRSFEDKLNVSDLTEALINAPGVRAAETESVDQRIRLMWGRGINLYRLSIEDLISVTMALAGEQTRCDFIAEVGQQLDAHARPSGRSTWRDLLGEVLDGVQPD